MARLRALPRRPKYLGTPSIVMTANGRTSNGDGRIMKSRGRKVGSPDILRRHLHPWFGVTPEIKEDKIGFSILSKTAIATSHGASDSWPLWAGRGYRNTGPGVKHSVDKNLNSGTYLTRSNKMTPKVERDI